MEHTKMSFLKPYQSAAITLQGVSSTFLTHAACNRRARHPFSLISILQAFD